MSEQFAVEAAPAAEQAGPEGTRLIEEIKVGAQDLARTVNDLVREATVRRITVVRKGRTLIDLPLPVGVAAGLELLSEMTNRLAKPNWVKGMREAGLPEDEVQDICERIMATHAPWKESTFPGLLGNVVSGRIANYFDLGGINCTSDAACASSFSALSQGINELYIGSSDVVLVGGADTTNDSFLFVSFSKTPALSPTQDCRPFSDKADGMVLGEGIGMLAVPLRRYRAIPRARASRHGRRQDHRHLRLPE